MAESGLGGRFWFKAALAACDARNATYKEHISTTPWRRMHGEVQDVPLLHAFGCRAWVYLDSDRPENDNHTACAVEAINLIFKPNTSAYCFFILEKNNLMTYNQARFDEYSFLFRQQKMVEQFQSDNSTDILYKNPSDVKWVPYNWLHITNYARVHENLTSDVMVMLANSEVNTYGRLGVTQCQWLFWTS